MIAYIYQARFLFSPFTLLRLPPNHKSIDSILCNNSIDSILYISSMCVLPFFITIPIFSQLCFRNPCQFFVFQLMGCYSIVYNPCFLTRNCFSKSIFTQMCVFQISMCFHPFSTTISLFSQFLCASDFIFIFM